MNVKLILGAVALLGILMVTSCGIEKVDVGSTGVKKVLGSVREEALEPGWYVINPLTTDVVSMDNQWQSVNGEATAYTKDVQQATIKYTMNYYLDPKHSVRVYSQIGIDWQSKLIPQVVLGNLKNVIGKWNAIDLVSNREKATAVILEDVRANLVQQGIVIKKLELTNIDYENAFEQAVEAKVVAVQNAEEAKNKTIRVQEEANQRVIAAEADAKAMQIKTAALDQSQSLILYEAVKTWNGDVPKVLSFGSGGGNMLNIPADMFTKQK